MEKSKRESGILMHISSLPGEYGIGSFGSWARAFVDFLADGGFSLWQVLPFCIPDEVNSPYKSVSAFSLNPYFIDLPTLYEKGLLTYDELMSARQNSPYLCEFSRLLDERLPLLMDAAERVLDRTEIIEFINDKPELSDACRFLALKDANGGKPWQEWGVAEPDAERLFFYQFLEYEFYHQWMSLKSYANGKGIKIIGDVPIYVAEDSADVWASPEQFLLDSNGYALDVAGVPPDYFCADGQLWGNPLYNWKRMKEDGFVWWKRRIEYNLELFDGVRIDHFRAFASYFSIPRSAASARTGRWRRGPGRQLIDVIRSVAKDRLIIAEDLGDITPDVVRLLKYSGFPGMRVLQFAFLGDTQTPHLPHNYERNCVAYTGTHDNNTLLGYVWGMDADKRDIAISYSGGDPSDWSDVTEALIRTVFASVADKVMLPIQDVMVFGEDTRMNTPGTSESNWAYRLSAEQLLSLPHEKFKRLNRVFGRA